MDTAKKNAAAPEHVIVKQKTNFQKTLSRFFSRPIAVIGLAIVVLMVFFSLFGGYATEYNFSNRNSKHRYQGPSAEHYFGTDNLGRDIYARVVDGSKITIVVALGSSLFAMALGSLLGLFSGFKGGAADSVISGFMNSLWALPTIVLAMAISVAMGSSITNIAISIGIVNIPSFYRIVRSRVLSIREMDYIMAARAIGRPTWKIIFQHVLPNLISTLIVETTMACSKAVIAEASLSFLGLGVPLPRASWGMMLKDGYALLERAPWMSIFPGIFIMLLVLGFNFLGDGLRDAFDVKIRAD